MFILTLDKLIVQEAAQGDFKPARIEHVRHNLHISERRACAALGQHRSTARRIPRGHEDEEQLTLTLSRLPEDSAAAGCGVAGQ
jgi:hypothetical protein